jgi:serine/threonine protein kinase/tetratricopeptide (TPR) repeat protein
MTTTFGKIFYEAAQPRTQYFANSGNLSMCPSYSNPYANYTPHTPVSFRPVWSKSAQIGSNIDAHVEMTIISPNTRSECRLIFNLLATRDALPALREKDIMHTLGKYTLIQRLGEGGMTEVWLARHPRLGREVTIKRLHPHIARQPGVKERFQRGAQALVALRHPHIIQVHDFEVTGDEAYFVMEYIAGSTLEARLQSLRDSGRPMSFEEIWPTFAAIASAVNCAHRSGVIHRNLKPSNVLLRSDGTPVVSDFGLAYVVEGTRYTQTAGTLGTPAYIAPEQCDRRSVDARTDIYALGILLFELITGRLPFKAEHPVELILKHIQTPPPHPSRWRADLSPEIETVILRALDKNPANRFATVSDMLSSLPSMPSIIQDRDFLPVALPTPSIFHPYPLTLVGDQFTDEIKTAFQGYSSLLELAQSPLAHSPLIAPTLILNVLPDEQITADARGRALRIVLRWAVNRLAPAPPRYPMGTHRPADDPTWQNPLWWKYNILRHRYVEPLHPDGFPEGYKLVGTLIARMGLSSRDCFYTERDRAIDDVAILLREQITRRQCDAELQRLAAKELYYSLKNDTIAQDLLGIAATLRDVFPRSLLIDMASRENILHIEDPLGHLLAQRLLQPRDNGHVLMIPPAIQTYVHARQPEPALAQRHQLAARFYLDQGRPIEVAWHLKMAGRPAEAADVLLETANRLVDSLEMEALRNALLDFASHQLDAARWCDVQILLSDLWRGAGDQKKARKACREALRAAIDPTQQARVYRRLGKLYEDRDQDRAMDYYQRASERFPVDHLERLALLKDRAWLYIHQRKWEEAESDLTLALEITNRLTSVQAQEADIHNALAGLYRRQERYKTAIRHARQSLTLREEHSDLQQIAHSWNNLGLIYAKMGNPSQAIPAYEEALKTFQQMENQEAIATVSLNIGVAHYYADRLGEAVEHYQQSLAIFREIDLPRGEAEAHYNLAEALIKLEQDEEAHQHLQAGHAISQRAELSDLLQMFESLRDETDESVNFASESDDFVFPPTLVTSPAKRVHIYRDLDLSPEEQTAIEITKREGHVTSRALMKEAQISKSTATRKLSHLFDLGLLERKGKGRGTHYVIPQK